MAKIKAARVNLSTQAKDILETMREEMPKAYYFFRKNFGGKQKYLKHEDQMLDKALEEKNDQFTDIEYWMSKDYHDQAADELKKVNGSKQPRSVKQMYKSPIWMLKLKRQVMKWGSAVKQLIIRLKVRG